MAQVFELGARVYIPRSHGGESVAYVLEYDTTRGLYTVELDARNSGNCKLATADFLSLEPKGVASEAPAGFRRV